jgi:hypothetical protein
MMAQRIRRFGVGQTAKVLGVLYALLGLVFAPFLVIAALFAPDTAGFGIGFAIAIPIVYGVVGFIFTAIGCLIYNLVAGWVGGIEIDVIEAVG